MADRLTGIGEAPVGDPSRPTVGSLAPGPFRKRVKGVHSISLTDGQLTGVVGG